MTITTRAFNGTTAYIAKIGIENMAIKCMLLDQTAAEGYDATHATIDEVIDGDSASVTISIATPGVVTWNGHGLADGTAVMLTTTGALPTGLDAGTWYFIVNSDTNTFELAATAGGDAIDTSGAQSGVHTAFADGGEQVYGNGWPVGGKTLSNVSVSTVTTNDALVDADDPEVTATGGQIGYAYGHVFYDGLTGRVLKHTDYGEGWRAGEGTPFIVHILSGLFNVNYTPA